MSNWVLLSARMESSIKDWVAEFALGHRVTMSEVLRRAIVEYLSNHSESDDEVTAAETVRRKREEDVRLLVPKDTFDSYLFPCRVTDFVYKVKSEWEERGFLTHDRYDHLVQLVDAEIDVIKGNPHERLLAEMLGEVIEGLRKEQAQGRMKDNV